MTLRAYRVGTTVMHLHTIHAYGCEVHPEEDLREVGYGSRLQSAELLSRELFPIGPLVSYFLTARTHSFFSNFLFFVVQNEIKYIASSP